MSEAREDKAESRCNRDGAGFGKGMGIADDIIPVRRRMRRKVRRVVGREAVWGMVVALVLGVVASVARAVSSVGGG